MTLIAIQVYISARSAKDCESTARELTALGPGKCFAIPADMQEKSEVSRLVSELSSKETRLDVLVNNAGAAWGDSIDNYPVCSLHDANLSVLEADDICVRMGQLG